MEEEKNINEEVNKQEEEFKIKILQKKIYGLFNKYLLENYPNNTNKSELAISFKDNKLEIIEYIKAISPEFNEYFNNPSYKPIIDYIFYKYHSRKIMDYYNINERIHKEYRKASEEEKKRFKDEIYGILDNYKKENPEVFENIEVFTKNFNSKKRNEILKDFINKEKKEDINIISITSRHYYNKTRKNFGVKCHIKNMTKEDENLYMEIKKEVINTLNKYIATIEDKIKTKKDFLKYFNSTVRKEALEDLKFEYRVFENKQLDLFINQISSNFNTEKRRIKFDKKKYKE